MPAFHLVSPILKNYEPVTQRWNDKILEFGIPLFLLSIIFTWLVDLLASRKKSQKTIFKPREISYIFLVYILVFCVPLSLFCIAIGLGRMGSEAVRLPFHLSGIINIFRWTFVPTIFAVLIENQMLQGKKIPKYVYLFFLIWCVIEIFAWMSKSVLLYHLAPVALLFLLKFKPSFNKIIRLLAPILIAFFILYPIVEVMRTHDRNISLVESFTSARNEVEDENDNNRLLQPLNRMFLFGAQFPQNSNYINQNELFDFSNIQLLYLSGGAAGFQTFIIDRYPDGAYHSSGTSGLMDPLLHGGKGFMYIIVFLLSLMSVFVDKLIEKKYYSIGVILFLMLLNYITFVNVSTLYDSTGLQTLFVNLACIYIAYRLNFKRVKHGKCS